jgi:hypothetical protein
MSKSNAAYDMLISLCDKLTCTNDVITPEAVDKLEDELDGIYTKTKGPLSPLQKVCPPQTR